MAAFVLFLVLIALADSCDVCKKKHHDDDHHDRLTHWDEDRQSSFHLDVNHNNIYVNRPRDDECHERGHRGHHGHCVGPCNKCCTKPIIRNACSRVEGVNIPFESITGMYAVTHAVFRGQGVDLNTQCPTAVLSADDRTTCAGEFATILRSRADSSIGQRRVANIIYSCGHFTAVDLSRTPPLVLNGVIVSANSAGLAIMLCENIEGDNVVLSKAVFARNINVPTSETAELRQCLDEVDTTLTLEEVNNPSDCFKPF